MILNEKPRVLCAVVALKVDIAKNYSMKREWDGRGAG